MRLELSKKFSFEAAHWLPCFPEGHKCRRMHGHSFVVEVFVQGQMVAEQGYLIDYAEIKAIVKPLIDQLDHYVLNEVGDQLREPLLQNPTSENLAIWFYRQLKPRLPLLHHIRVFETCTSSCTYFGD
ncbi:MAG: 6-carboxytetrahydropterin synthase QueD [Sphingobacteriia bacterium]|jgi:6-pyruvoyltetrahydropterin/6-carboxytetrahydropterin synthase